MVSYSKILKKIYSSVALGILLTMAVPCSASVPHSVEKYNFHIDLPDGFTKIVTEEVPYQRVYDSYHGNHEDKSFVRVHIQKEDGRKDWNDERLRKQLTNTVNVYQAQGAKIVKAELVHLKNNDGILIHSQHNGKNHLSLQQYWNGTMYVVTCTFDGNDKYGLKEFMRMMYSVKCLNSL